MKQLLALALLCATASAAAPLVTPAAPLRVANDGDNANASGTYISIDTSRPVEESINTVRIGCERKAHRCIEAIASVSDNHELQVHYQVFRITSWNDGEITSEQTLACRKQILTINLSRKSAYKTIRLVENAARCEGSTAGQLKTPVIYQLAEPGSATPAK